MCFQKDWPNSMKLALQSVINLLLKLALQLWKELFQWWTLYCLGGWKINGWGILGFLNVFYRIDRTIPNCENSVKNVMYLRETMELYMKFIIKVWTLIWICDFIGNRQDAKELLFLIAWSHLAFIGIQEKHLSLPLKRSKSTFSHISESPIIGLCTRIQLKAVVE